MQSAAPPGVRRLSSRPTIRRCAWSLAGRLLMLCVSQWASLTGHSAHVCLTVSSISNAPGSLSSGPRAPSRQSKTLRGALHMRGGQSQEGGTAVKEFLARCGLSTHADVFERERIQVKPRNFSRDPAPARSRASTSCFSIQTPPSPPLPPSVTLVTTASEHRIDLAKSRNPPEPGTLLSREPSCARRTTSQSWTAPISQSSG